MSPKPSTLKIPPGQLWRQRPSLMLLMTTLLFPIHPPHNNLPSTPSTSGEVRTCSFPTAMPIATLHPGSPSWTWEGLLSADEIEYDDYDSKQLHLGDRLIS